MKEEIKKILTLTNQWKVILVVILIGAGLFYWFQIRPSMIYSGCYRMAMENAQELYAERFPWKKEEIEKRYFLPDVYELYYKLCLQKRGISK